MPMPNWEYWKAFLTGGAVGGAVVTGLTIIKNLIEVKTLLGNKAKPELFEIKNFILREVTFQEYAKGCNGSEYISFDLLINNKGTKDCSLTSIAIVFPNKTVIPFNALKSGLPRIIKAGLTEPIIAEAFTYTDILTKNQKTEATLEIDFNIRKKIIKKMKIESASNTYSVSIENLFFASRAKGFNP